MAQGEDGGRRTEAGQLLTATGPVPGPWVSAQTPLHLSLTPNQQVPRLLEIPYESTGPKCTRANLSSLSLASPFILKRERMRPANSKSFLYCEAVTKLGAKLPAQVPCQLPGGYRLRALGLRPRGCTRTVCTKALAVRLWMTVLPGCSPDLGFIGSI